MPAAFFSMIWGSLAAVLSTLVGRILTALAIGYVSYSGIDILLENIRTLALQHMGNMGPLVGVVGMLKLGESLNVVVSAVLAKYAIAGLTNGSITRMVFKK